MVAQAGDSWEGARRCKDPAQQHVNHRSEAGTEALYSRSADDLKAATRPRAAAATTTAKQFTPRNCTRAANNRAAKARCTTWPRLRGAGLQQQRRRWQLGNGPKCNIFPVFLLFFAASPALPCIARTRRLAAQLRLCISAPAPPQLTFSGVRR